MLNHTDSALGNEVVILNMLTFLGVSLPSIITKFSRVSWCVRFTIGNVLPLVPATSPWAKFASLRIQGHILRSLLMAQRSALLSLPSRSSVVVGTTIG